MGSIDSHMKNSRTSRVHSTDALLFPSHHFNDCAYQWVFWFLFGQMCESLGEDRVHFALEIVSCILAVVDGLCDRCRQRKDRDNNYVFMY